MPRATDESRRAEARRLYAAHVPAKDIAARLGVGQRQVQRWCEDLSRGPGRRPDPAVSDERVIYLRDVEGLSYAAVAAQTGLASWTSARERYRAAKGLPRPDRPPPANRDRPPAARLLAGTTGTSVFPVRYAMTGPRPAR